MVLVYSDTGDPVKVGDIVKTFRGEVVKVESIREPYYGGTGRVYVKSLDTNAVHEYFPGVICALWVESHAGETALV